MEVDLPYCSLRFTHPVITLKVKEDATVEADDALEILKASNSLAGNKPYAILTDARVYFNITPEARKIFSNKKHSHLIEANAVVVNNLPSKLIANFFANFNRPPYPYQVFTNSEKAKKWLIENLSQVTFRERAR